MHRLCIKKPVTQITGPRVAHTGKLFREAASHCGKVIGVLNKK